MQTNLYFNSSIWDRCNVHAFCWTCAEADGSLNKHCEAVMQKYNYEAEYGAQGTPSEAKAYVMSNMDYWCNDTVLSSIAHGTYKAKLEAGLL